ncbi:hypothetical protein E4T56_gene12778 [Termitomyces sp. T112]|nr:hypothetical protein E4T56_gene12778 [Termitomyces sp. T112]
MRAEATPLLTQLNGCAMVRRVSLLTSCTDQQMCAAPTEEGPSLSVAAVTTNPALSSGASSEDTLSEESMELDYIDDSALTMIAQPAMTPQVVPSPTEVVVATNIATLTASEAGSSGFDDMANTVLEHWADIVRNKEVEALKMDEQAE